MASDDSVVRPDDLRAVSGALRYAFGVSDSLLLKLYGVAFVALSAFLTLYLVVALVFWMGRLQGAAPTGEVWGFLPFLVVIYLAIEGLLFAPLYLPMRRYRARLDAEGDDEHLDEDLEAADRDADTDG